MAFARLLMLAFRKRNSNSSGVHEGTIRKTRINFYSSRPFVAFGRPIVGQPTPTPDDGVWCVHASQDKTAKKINFETFVEAVKLIAQKMNKSPDDVINIIVTAKGPT